MQLKTNDKQGNIEIGYAENGNSSDDFFASLESACVQAQSYRNNNSCNITVYLPGNGADYGQRKIWRGGIAGNISGCTVIDGKCRVAVIFKADELLAEVRRIRFKNGNIPGQTGSSGTGSTGTGTTTSPATSSAFSVAHKPTLFSRS